MGCGWGFGIPAVAMAIAVASFFRVRSCIETKDQEGVPLLESSRLWLLPSGKLELKSPTTSLFYSSRKPKTQSYEAIKSNGHIVCTTRQHNVASHEPIIRDPFGFTISLRDDQCYFLGSSL
ncbi:hypothetical protein PVK06_003761 [Gossypium arboreum]|uniref:Uncharacterized protein n=1 Tax=Gossypium arboreum TaxID=29729 RepID=A0ABR0QQ60_GOSAR|nr:hypothetical protein PVK06_003761 [Gossypium arboreum]